SQHEQLAVGEVDEPHNAVHHCVAQGDQRVDGAQRQTVDQLFGENAHRNDDPRSDGDASGSTDGGGGYEAPPPLALRVALVAGVDDPAVFVHDVGLVDGAGPVARRLKGDRARDAVDLQFVA